MEEHKEHIVSILELMLRPAFSVEGGCIRHVNQAASRYLLTPGTAIAPLICSGQDEYAQFTGGSLYITLQLGEDPIGVCVTRMGEYDLFLPDQQEDIAELRAMALAAKELREPLTGILAITGRMQEDAPSAQLNRRLFQMMRTICNMSDAFRYAQAGAGRMEYVEISAFFEDILEKSADLLNSAGVSVQYSGLSEAIYTLADPERLERAVYNMLSNAAKFSVADSVIEVTVTRKGNRLSLSVINPGTGILDSANVFNRFQREPRLEDRRFGLGLGMVMIRSAASAHGGAVLIDEPESGRTRTTMTLRLQHSKDTAVRSPVLRIDYAGEWDHALLELSDCLPAEVYEEV